MLEPVGGSIRVPSSVTCTTRICSNLCSCHQNVQFPHFIQHQVWGFICYFSWALTRCDFFNHLSWGVAAVDDVSGPQGQVLGGLHPKEVSLDAKSRASPRGKKQLCPRVGGTTIRAGVNKAGWIKEEDDIFIGGKKTLKIIKICTLLLCPTKVLQWHYEVNTSGIENTNHYSTSFALFSSIKRKTSFLSPAG